MRSQLERLHSEVALERTTRKVKRYRIYYFLNNSYVLLLILIPILISFSFAEATDRFGRRIKSNGGCKNNFDTFLTPGKIEYQKKRETFKTLVKHVLYSSYLKKNRMLFAQFLRTAI